MSVSPIRFDSLYTRSNTTLSKMSNNSGAIVLNSSRIKNETVSLEGGPTLAPKFKTIKPEGGPTLAPGTRESRLLPSIKANPGVTTIPIKLDPITYDSPSVAKPIVTKTILRLPPVADGVKSLPTPLPIEPGDFGVPMDPPIRFLDSLTQLSPSEKMNDSKPWKQVPTILWDPTASRDRPVQQPPGFDPIGGTKGDPYPNRLKPLSQPLPIQLGDQKQLPKPLPIVPSDVPIIANALESPFAYEDYVPVNYLA